MGEVVNLPVANKRVIEAIDELVSNPKFLNILERLPDRITMIDIMVNLPNGKERRYVIEIDAETEGSL